MWKGYLGGDNQNDNMLQFLRGIDYTYLHTSGHANAETIEMLITITKPDVIIPIHTENAAWFHKKYPCRTVSETIYNT